MRVVAAATRDHANVTRRPTIHAAPLNPVVGKSVERWQADYNHVRPQAAQGGLTPEVVRLKPGRSAAQPRRYAARPRTAGAAERHFRAIPCA